MQARHRTGFPGHQVRVLSGAGDEEAFETKASPPAVAGPLERLAAAAAVTLRSAGLPLECGVVLLQPHFHPAVTGTSAAAAGLLRWDLAAHQGPVTEVLAGGPPVEAFQGRGDVRWPDFSAQAHDAGMAGSLAVRLRLGCWGEWPGCSAALAVYSRGIGGFPLEVIATVRALAVPAAKSLTSVLGTSC